MLFALSQHRTFHQQQRMTDTQVRPGYASATQTAVPGHSTERAYR